MSNIQPRLTFNETIFHRPLFKSKAIEDHYSKKDGVEVKYVCTSALDYENQAMDIFYRETSHPEFGNKYFGLFLNPYNEMSIVNADKIEEVEFGMKRVGDFWHYSQHRHDFYTVGDVSLDGGRAYFRCVGNVKSPTNFFIIKSGDFIEAK